MPEDGFPVLGFFVPAMPEDVTVVAPPLWLASSPAAPEGTFGRATRVFSEQDSTPTLDAAKRASGRLRLRTPSPCRL